VIHHEMGQINDTRMSVILPENITNDGCPAKPEKRLRLPFVSRVASPSPLSRMCRLALLDTLILAKKVRNIFSIFSVLNL
jgi:hypothetical protein